ncbi:DUF1963 domain-containing protein [Streptomyces bluensis]|uniref:DUF1963 domain-containing protein n=1 Tax=Streptomyces bluensis TaxID=33897 RepID=UPI00332780DD
MHHDLIGRLQPFREEALRRGIPSEDVERWIAMARPAGTLTAHGTGPFVGRFGGPLMLPADVPDPAYPLLATLDCAALPEKSTGVPLPVDGRLLLFGYPEMAYFSGNDSAGSVLYVPAGMPVEKRASKFFPDLGDQEEDEDEVDEEILDLCEQYPQDELRLSADVSLPHHFMGPSPEPGQETAEFPGHPRAGDLARAWSDTCGDIIVDGALRIGGYASHECTETDPIAAAAEEAILLRQQAVRSGEVFDSEELPAPENWVLLAQWDVDVQGREGATLHWVIPYQDIVERRFDRVHVSFFWNP